MATTRVARKGVARRGCTAPNHEGASPCRDIPNRTREAIMIWNQCSIENGHEADELDACCGGSSPIGEEGGEGSL